MPTRFAISRRAALGQVAVIVGGFLDRSVLSALPRSVTTIAQKGFGSPASVLDRVGVNVRASELSPLTLDLVADYEFRWIRTDISWRVAESSVGMYDFASVRSGLEAAATRRLKVLGILDYGHPIHTGMLAPRGPAQRGAFVRFAADAQRQLGHLVTAWEVWNEPNHPHFWPPQPDAAEFVALLSDVAGALWKGDPHAIVISGGLSTIDERFLADLIPVVESLGRNGSLGLGLHPYRNTPPETVTADLERVGLLRDGGKAATSGGVPVWLTEWGYCRGGVGITRQTEWVPRIPLVGVALDAPLTVVFELRDGGPQDVSAYTCGLVSAQGKPYPVGGRWTAIASTAQAIAPVFRRVPRSDESWAVGSCSAALVWPEEPTLQPSAVPVACVGNTPGCTGSVWRVAPGKDYWLQEGKQC